MSKKLGNKRQPAYSKISLFKMILLSHWYDLSDVGTEELVKDSIGCMRFCGFQLEDQTPAYTTLCIIRNEIVPKKVL
ncbi:MAG: transposase [Flavobacteriales bacterium Tduv]